MKIHSVEASGFRGIKNKIRVDFPAGFLVLTGSNGAGKSSIFDAIEFALTGSISKYERASSEKGESVSDYIWWRGANPPEDRYVRLSLATEGGANIIVTRTPAGAEVSGADVPLREMLCDLQANPESDLQELCRTSIIRDELIAASSVDLAETDRFSFVRSAVGSQNHSHLEAKLNDAAEAVKKRITAVEREYESARLRVQATFSRLGAAQAQATQASKANEAESQLRGLLGLTRGDYQELLSHAAAESERLRIRVDVLNRFASRIALLHQRSAQLEKTGALKQLAELRAQLAQKEMDRAIALSKLDGVAAEIEQARDGRSNVASLAQLHLHGKEIGLQNGHCPLCGSSVQQSSFDTHLQQIADFVKEHGERLARLVADQQSYRRFAMELQTESDRLRNSVGKLQADVESIDSQRELIKTEMDANVALVGVTPNSAATELESAKMRLRNLEQHQTVLQNSQIVDELVNLQRDLEVAQAHALNTERALGRLRVAQERLRDGQNTLKRIAAEAVEDRLAGIKPLFMELYGRLRPHVDWKDVDYLIRGDVRRFLSLRIGDGLNLKFLFSSGQRRAAGLAFLLAVALSRQWCRLKSILLDDPIQHVDDFRSINLVETLAAIRRLDYQVVCAVEDEALAELLARRLRSSFAASGRVVRLQYVGQHGTEVAEISEILPFDQTIVVAA